MNDALARKRIILDLDKNILVKASAGSGKTTILVERIVALIEKGVPISEIVAVTFTKKAANEFYERLYHKLELRSRDDFDKVIHDKYSLLENPTKDEKERDKAALIDIDSCFLGTMDSFVQRIIKEHPLEAGVPASTEIISDDDLRLLVFKLQSIFEVSDDLFISKARKYFNKYANKEDFVPMVMFLNNYLDYDFKLPEISLDELEQNYIEEAKRVQAGLIKLDKYLKEGKISKTFGVNSKPSQKAIECWKNFDQRINYIKGLNIDDGLLTLNLFTSKLFSTLDITFNEEVLLEELIPYMEEKKNIKRINLDLHSANALIFYSLFVYPHLISKEITTFLTEEGRITFNHASKLVVNLLRRDDGKSIDILSHLKERYKYFLIDESQDTDAVQYELFLRLTGSENKDNYKEIETVRGGALFIVGDKKQSIYHFKGADVSTYLQIHDLFLDKEKEGKPYEVIELTNNFRSEGHLTSYFNDAFNLIMGNLGYEPVPDKESKFDYSGAYLYKTDSENKAQDGASIVENIVGSGLYSYRDFMIITSGKNPIKEIASIFLERNIPFFSEGNISYDSEIIKATSALFMYATNPNDFNKYRLLISPLFNADITRPIDNELSLLEETLLPLENEIPSQYLTRLIKDKILSEKFSLEGFDILVGLIHFLKAKEFDAEVTSLYSASKAIEDLISTSERERFALIANNINAVHIANVHKVKGLQNKIVILYPSGNSSKSPAHYIDQDNKVMKIFHLESGKSNYKSNVANPNILLDDPDIEKEKQYQDDEKIRLLYVAATRAEHMLLIPERDKGDVWDRLYKGLSLDYFTPFEKGNISQISQVEDSYNPLFNKEKHIRDGLKSNYKISIASKGLVKIYQDDEEEDDYFTVFDDITNYDQFDSKLFGSMVHKLMEDLVKRQGVLPEEILDLVIEEFGANEKYKGPLSNVYNQIISGGYPQNDCPFFDILKEIKENECYHEVPFSFMEDNILRYGIIDLLIVKKDKIIIVDYKTDSVEVDHTSQLNAYINAVKRFDIAKDKDVEAYIYNIKEEKSFDESD